MKHMVMRVFALAVLATTAAPVTFASQHANHNSPDHAMIVPDEMKWSAGPDGLPRGAEVTLLEGDPAKAGSFTLRLKFPANYRIAPHWHPVTEHVTVLSGNLYMGLGDHFDENKATHMPSGSFAYMQPKVNHFAFTHGPATIQLHGIGPWGITYVNPADDPRNQNQDI